MSDTKPYQAAAERVEEECNGESFRWGYKGVREGRVELIRAAIAAEVDAEQKAIVLALSKIATPLKMRSDGDAVCVGFGLEDAAALVEKRIGAPSALEAMIEEARQAERGSIIGIAQHLLVELGGCLDEARKGNAELQREINLVRAERDRAIAERDRSIRARDEERKL